MKRIALFWWWPYCCCGFSGSSSPFRGVVGRKRSSAYVVVAGGATTTTSFRTLRGDNYLGSAEEAALQNYNRRVALLAERGTSNNSNNQHEGRINGEGATKSESVVPNQSPTRPQTGWNHNLPSPASDFWKGPRNEKNPSSSSSLSSGETKLRTGWLHNSQPVSTMSNSNHQQQRDSSTTPAAPKNMARRRLELAKRQQERNHRMISPPSFHACQGDTIVAVTEHVVSVPLVRGEATNNNKNNNKIDIYFSIVEKVETEEKRIFLQEQLTPISLSPNQRAQKYVEHAALRNADAMVLFLQGGPGFGAPIPGVSLSLSKGSGSWADAALFNGHGGYNRIVLMDQRGTGKSTPITKQTLQYQFPDLFVLDTDDDDDDDIASNSRSLYDETIFPPSPEKDRVLKAVDDVTEYLTHFRADNIVQDAECIRDALMLETLEDFEDDNSTDESGGGGVVFTGSKQPRPFGCSLGQSYGGFCHMTYLSQVEHPPKIMLFTGGIAPMLSEIDDVYSALWDQVQERNRRYYDMYPGDIATVKLIVRKLLQCPVQLPSGGRLTARRFLSLGISLGGSPSAFASLHELIATAFAGGPTIVSSSTNEEDAIQFSNAFLKQIDVQQSFDDHPIYFWLHESIYADGPDRSPTNWSAHRAYQKKLMDANSVFDYERTSHLEASSEPTLFFGEHVFPWMPEDFAGLSGVGLRAVANAIANKSDWSPLFDADHMKLVLREGRTRAAAAVYYEDMYVEFNACMKVTARDGPLGLCRVYVTNEYQHSGLRDGGATLFSKLHGMVKGGNRTPS